MKNHTEMTLDQLKAAALDKVQVSSREGITETVGREAYNEVNAISQAFANAMSYELYEKLREESDGDGLTLSAAIKVNMIEGIVEVTITGAIKVKFNGSEQIKDANQRTFDFDED